MSRAGPPGPGNGNGANNHERAESKAAANLATVYPSHEFAASENRLGPGTAPIPLTQGRFAFDAGAPFGDARIEAYIRVLARELTDDGVRAFLRARFAYQTFQRLGTPEARRFAWHAIWLASSHVSTKGTSSNAILGDPGKSERAI